MMIRSSRGILWCQFMMVGYHCLIHVISHRLHHHDITSYIVPRGIHSSVIPHLTVSAHMNESTMDLDREGEREAGERERGNERGERGCWGEGGRERGSERG